MKIFDYYSRAGYTDIEILVAANTAQQQRGTLELKRAFSRHWTEPAPPIEFLTGIELEKTHGVRNKEYSMERNGLEWRSYIDKVQGGK